MSAATAIAVPARKRPPGPGRPPRLNADLIRRAADLIGAGLPAASVAARLEVAATTYGRWLASGRKAEKQSLDPQAQPLTPKQVLYLEFLRAHKKAEACAEHRWLARIECASESNWTAAAWILERRHPDRWGSQRRELNELRKQLGELSAQLAQLTAKGAKP